NENVWEVNEPIKSLLQHAAFLADASASYSFEEIRWWLQYISMVDWPGRWLIDCVFSNPFYPVGINPLWLTWNDGKVRKIAKAMYDDRAFDRPDACRCIGRSWMR